VDYEEVEEDPGVSDKRLLCYESEFASVLKVMDRQGNTVSQMIRQAWDGLPLRTMTKNSPARCEQPHVSIIGHVTSEELRRYLTATEQANGYGNRHLWVCVRRSKLLPEGGGLPAAELDRLHPAFARALEFAAQTGEMGFTPDARNAWHAVYGELSEGKPGLGGALLGRAEAHVRRLACVYALLGRSADVDVPHLRAALAVWEYVEASVAHVFGQQTGDPLADDILAALRSSPEGLTRDDIRQLFQRHRSSSEIGRALGLLLKYKLAYPRRVETGGRPAERWFAGRAPAP
jgi:hypothetical protein